MKKKVISLLLVGIMAVTSLAGCGTKTETAKTQGKVLNIHCWNTEFQDRFEYFKKSGKLPSDVKVNFVVTPNENNAYQNALDAALKKQDTAAADDKVDIFLVEADYALKYVNTDYTLDVTKDIGLTKDDLANQYQYTKDIVTNSKGIQKGVTWQATPGLFAYSVICSPGHKLTSGPKSGGVTREVYPILTASDPVPQKLEMVNE